MKKYTLLWLIVLLFLTYCKKAGPVKTIAEKKIAKELDKPLELKTLELKPIKDEAIHWYVLDHHKFSKYEQAAKEFYRKRGNEYVWFTNEGMTPRIDMFLNMTYNAEHKTDISGDSLVYLYQNIRNDTSLSRVENALLNLELRLTLGFFAFAEKEWTGSEENLIKQLEWYIPKKKIQYASFLDSLIKNEADHPDAIKLPMYSQYNLLKGFLEKYRLIETQGGWSTIHAEKKSYKLGDQSKVVSQIKRRLYLTGDFASNDTNPVFDKALVEAVKLFERRYGMTEDGKVGPSVIAEMNTPVHHRIEQILINIERCRWVPFERSEDYLMVNIPEFKLHAYEKNKKVWDMNVVVGKATHKTVIFYGKLQYIVFNPYWTVTNNIFNQEFLPQLRKHSSYLKSHQMVLTKASDPNVLIDPATVNWNLSQSSYHQYIVKQKPGQENALGKVKFIFPNEYNIYLHDTPAKALFSETNRSFSHGCIRVEKPEELAKYLLRDEPNWNDKAFDKVWSAPVEQYVPLKKKVSVFIAYFTSWVDDQGKLNFRNDIYGHDAKMAKILIEKPYL